MIRAAILFCIVATGLKLGAAVINLAEARESARVAVLERMGK